MRMLRLVPALAALSLVVVACGGGGSAATEPSAAGTAPVVSDMSSTYPMDIIRDRAYSSTKVTENGQDKALASDTPITVTFTDSGLSAQAGCNTLTGGFELVQQILTVDQLASTKMACEQALMDQDTWLSSFLTSKPKLDVAGDTLVMANSTTTIELAPAK